MIWGVLFAINALNIAHVEYHFSDFLSGMESGSPISLHGNDDDPRIPEEIRIPRNVYVTGTINVDETTHEISPKVLDRAYVLVLGTDWAFYSSNPRLKAELGETFSELLAEGGAIRRAAQALEPAGLGFGYRTAEDIV